MIESIKRFECSVVVCTYRPNWDKLRLTLKSILMQKKCKFQIIVTDDGSEENLFKKIQKYFADNSFTDFKLIDNLQNNGTVHNVLQGVYASDGELIKPISPGDFLHGEYCLREWIDFMDEHDDYVMSYCDSIYYHWGNGKVIPIEGKANPQSTEPDVLQYIVYDDVCLGASAMVRRQEWLNCLELIQGKIIYCEDSTYPIMLFQGMKIINIPRTLLLYEVGSGVSTCESSFWHEQIRKDVETTNKILLSLNPGNDNKRIIVNKYLSISAGDSVVSKCKRIMICPSIILYRIKQRFFSRKTPMKLNIDFVHDLLA